MVDGSKMSWQAEHSWSVSQQGEAIYRDGRARFLAEHRSNCKQGRLLRRVPPAFLRVEVHVGYCPKGALIQIALWLGVLCTLLAAQIVHYSFGNAFSGRILKPVLSQKVRVAPVGHETNFDQGCRHICLAEDIVGAHLRIDIT